jgi:thiamine pyrophosphokinase
MRRRRDFIIFTHGVYKSAHLNFYRGLCRSRFTIAVDGGIRFFLKADMTPELLIGDMDSLSKVPGKLSRRIKEVITLPARKDKTDLHLAVEYCLDQEARSIDIVTPSFGQPDHFLGNLMLVHFIDKQRRVGAAVRMRFINVYYEIIYVRDSSETFVGFTGDVVSVMPLSERIRLTTRGTEYDVDGVTVRRGETLSLRNRINARRAVFDISGKAFLIRNFSQQCQ